MRLNTIFDTDDETGFIYRWFLKKRDPILTDNVVFFLHYHVTAALFIIGCLIVTVGMFIMDPIDCITDRAVDDVIDNYCLYHSTYTIAVQDLGNAKECKLITGCTDLVAHPGISSTSKKSTERVKFDRFYLWVALMLVIQGASFYIPRGIWRVWGCSEVDNILKEKDEAFSVSNEEAPNSDNSGINTDVGAHFVTDMKLEDLLRGPVPAEKYLMQKNYAEDDKLQEQNFRRLSLYILSKSHNMYYWKLLTCEGLNLANAFLQLSIMNSFLGLGLSRENLWFNKDIFQLFQETRPFQKSDVVERIFPKISACTFYSYGPTGSIVNYEAICVLPINAINEKIYVALYVWLLFLIVISALAILYRLLIIHPIVRKSLLKVHLRSEELSNFSLNKLGKRLKIGNWQLLLQLTGNSNMDSWELTNIVKHLCRKCENMDKENKNA